MKLSDIHPSSHRSITDNQSLVNSISREESIPEIAQLLSFRGAMLVSCQLLSDDERQMATQIILWLDADVSYKPACAVLQFMRSINAKLALCSSSPEAVT